MPAIVLATFAIVFAIVASRRTAIVLTTGLRSGRCRSICKGTIRWERDTVRFQLIRAADSLHDIHRSTFLKNGVYCFSFFTFLYL